MISILDCEQVDFDVEVAIKVCRQAGYCDHALKLAEKHRYHQWFLQIQLEDKKNFKGSLDYITSLDFHNAKSNILKHGALLMKHLPGETTEFLKLICTDFKSRDQPLISEEALHGQAEKVYKADPEEFLQLFIRNNDGLIVFLEYLIAERPTECSDVIYNHLLEHYLHKFKNMESNHDDDVQAFLKRKSDIESKIMKILSSPYLSFDNDHALVLCQMHNFLKGTLHLYERKGLHQQILKIHMEMNNVEAALATCRSSGAQNPNLWVQALQLVGSIEDQKTKEMHIMEVLDMIEDQNLMTPLQVLRTLANSPLANLGIVRQYLLVRL